MRTVTILLTRYSDWFGKFICGISKYKYSHTSISIDEAEEIFYSFNYKGFVIEKPKKKRVKSRLNGSVCIRIQVPDDNYEIIKQEIEHFVSNREIYTYSRIGVIFCLLHIPFKFKNQYFCSQFVAEILSQAGVVELKKKEELYLPGQFIDGFESIFSKKQVIYNEI
ncbi:MAG: hypothetical protein ACI4S2_11015 [Lachnospiraceae bacterium]